MLMMSNPLAEGGIIIQSALMSYPSLLDLCQLENLCRVILACCALYIGQGVPLQDPPDQTSHA